jgi:hypothetical protein
VKTYIEIARAGGIIHKQLTVALNVVGLTKFDKRQINPSCSL